jgi:hypothetical protein
VRSDDGTIEIEELGSMRKKIFLARLVYLEEISEENHKNVRTSSVRESNLGVSEYKAKC